MLQWAVKINRHRNPKYPSFLDSTVLGYGESGVYYHVARYFHRHLFSRSAASIARSGRHASTAMFGLGKLFYVALLYPPSPPGTAYLTLHSLINSIAILSEDRFLLKSESPP
jgi:hypothetical protein